MTCSRLVSTDNQRAPSAVAIIFDTVEKDTVEAIAENAPIGDDPALLPVAYPLVCMAPTLSTMTSRVDILQWTGTLDPRLVRHILKCRDERLEPTRKILHNVERHFWEVRTALPARFFALQCEGGRQAIRLDQPVAIDEHGQQVGMEREALVCHLSDFVTRVIRFQDDLLTARVMASRLQVLEHQIEMNQAAVTGLKVSIELGRFLTWLLCPDVPVGQSGDRLDCYVTSP